jgi:cobaltochelatase CobS
MSTNLPPINAAQRQALRAAIRTAMNNPPAVCDYNRAVDLLARRKVNDVSKPELFAIAGALCVDIPAVLNSVFIETEDKPNMPDPDTDATEAPDTTEAPEIDPLDTLVDTTIADMRRMLVDGGFAALDNTIRDLGREANKPARVITVRERHSDEMGQDVPHAAPGRVDTWGKVFGITGKHASNKIKLWSGAADTPEVNDNYIFPVPELHASLCAFARKRNVFLTGPAGTGKTDFARQIAARTGRPFTLISCHSGTEAAELVGMQVPAKGGGTTWRDGQLTASIRQPGMVVCIDEPDVARPGALMIFQNVLAARRLYIAETGESVPVADGVCFLGAANTNGTGGGARHGYTDTNRLNRAFLDRFTLTLRMGYQANDTEAALLCRVTGCNAALAELLVKFAHDTRQQATGQALTHGVGLRRLFALAEVLTDGVDAELAFDACILATAPEADGETLRQIVALHCSPSAVARALKGAPPVIKARPGTPQADFEPVSEGN